MLDGFGQAPVCLELDLDSYDGPPSHVARFRNRRGWLMVAEGFLTDADGGRQRAGIVVACDEWGEEVPAWQAAHLLDCACSFPQPCDEYAPGVLQALLDREARETRLRWLRENDRDLQRLAVTVEADVAMAERRADELVRRTLSAIDDLRRRRRSPLLTPDNRVAIDEAISSLEIGIEAALQNLATERDRLRQVAQQRERELLRRGAVRIELDVAYVASWHDGAPASYAADRHDRTWDDFRPTRVEFTYETARRNLWWRDRARGIGARH